MSRTIDERVVEMRFDNKQFEQNVQTSISSIEKLEKSLNLKGASKGLEDVNVAAKNCNMTPLSNAVETVKMRFSALEVMAMTALSNITNSALNAGKNIVSALTIDPIKTGFQEYETQINAVQTILANTQSKGTTIDQVNAALDELNKYADQTIYNFTEMTRNIGTFTAAGVDLDKSVTSIKGIANLAAASGSNAQQASTAMYQLSQAIAAGKVSLQPSMIKTNDRWQYPLAYIRVNSGVTSIRQENITNAVGTSECPFVTAPLEKMSIDALVAQWKDQWDAFYEKETSDMEATNSFWKDQWSKWFNAQTEEIQQSYLDWEKQWNDWYATQTADMQETNSYWKQLWATWFNEYTNNNTSEMAAWRENAQALFDEWFQQLKDTLSENVEANLANQILELQERTKILEEIVEGIRTEFTVYNKLYDNGYENHDKLLDSSDGTIIDSDIEPIVARAYSSSLILDSNGQPIDGRVIFCIR